MPFVVVAHHSQSASGTSVPNATEALAIVSALEAAGFSISAVINESGVQVEIADLQDLAEAEGDNTEI